MKRHLYLVGYRGTGKSTVGRLLAAELARPFADLDERIEATAGASIAEIFAAEGEAGFRDRESAALLNFSDPPLSASERGPGGEVSPLGEEGRIRFQLQTSPPSPLSETERGDKTSFVVATGGGIVLREENRKLLQATGFVVWLTASAEVLWERIQADAATAGRRPNLAGGGLAEIVELLDVRRRFYEEVHDAAVPTEGRSPEAVAASILTLYRPLPTD